jgi:Zn-dependent protease with chaperone function
VLAENDNAFSGRKERYKMSESSLMHGWMSLLGSFATIAIIVTAFGLMLGIVKPADAPKHIGAIMVIVIGLMVVPGILASAWSAMSLWQQIALAAIGVGVFLWLRPRRQPQKRKEE